MLMLPSLGLHQSPRSTSLLLLVTCTWHFAGGLIRDNIPSVSSNVRATESTAMEVVEGRLNHKSGQTQRGDESTGWTRASRTRWNAEWALALFPMQGNRGLSDLLYRRRGGYAPVSVVGRRRETWKIRRLVRFEMCLRQWSDRYLVRRLCLATGFWCPFGHGMVG
ncbi:hypothetical protein BDV59DRAFT_26826 [Aspergillus ambiguus]|uniref:uncharacterized protein n=1 Tax=Aspergillus ambiguus TaxID=176160 RepID=UPI003CCD9CB4